MTLCKFCGQDRPLIDAHAIPAAFFRDMASAKQAPLYMLSNDAVAAPQTGADRPL